VSVENQFGPLCTAGIMQGDDMQSGAVEEFRELLDARVGGVRRFEWTDPCIAVDVESGVARLDDVAGRKSGAANHVAHMLGENFFITNTILDGADGAVLTENMRGLFDGGARVSAFCGYDAELASWNFAGIGSRVQASGKIGGATDAQAAFVDGACVFFPDVVGVDFDVFKAGKMRAKDTSDGTAADNANFHAHADFSASTPG
jgi:hypothetical protein